MQKNMGQKQKKGNLYRNFLELVAVGSVTGIFSGAIVSVFTLLVHEGEKISRNFYGYVRENPAFLPLLLLALLASAFLMSVLMNISSVICGGGVPQAEGASRGSIPLKWWRDLSFMFAGTLLGVFSGLSIGSEGPSIFIGACTGDGVSKTLKRNPMIRKYQITGGACAGLAVAFNAPLMGMAFAFEEAHKRFTPEVFICAFSSVIFALLTRLSIYGILGVEGGSFFARYVFYEMPLREYLYVVPSGIVCGLLGVGFYRLCFFMRRTFGKIRAKGLRTTLWIRTTVALLFGGVVSLLVVDVMGGGSAFIENLGTNGGAQASLTSRVFSLPLVVVLLLVLIGRFLITSVNVGAGIPCGIFIPILAIGACVGGVLSEGWIALRMDEKYYDLMVMICMAAFFTTVIKAPLTAIIMTCELTGSFAPFLPVIIAVCIGYMIGELFKTDGIYEELLERYEREKGIHEQAVWQVYSLCVTDGSLADKREIRDVLWPAKAHVKEIHRGKEIILPEGNTRLQGGDELLIVCKTDQPESIKDELTHILG